MTEQLVGRGDQMARPREVGKPEHSKDHTGEAEEQKADLTAGIPVCFVTNGFPTGGNFIHS